MQLVFHGNNVALFSALPALRKPFNTKRDSLIEDGTLEWRRAGTYYDHFRQAP